MWLPTICPNRKQVEKLEEMTKNKEEEEDDETLKSKFSKNENKIKQNHTLIMNLTSLNKYDDIWTAVRLSVLCGLSHFGETC